MKMTPEDSNIVERMSGAHTAREVRSFAKNLQPSGELKAEKATSARAPVREWRLRFDPESYHMERGEWVCDGCGVNIEKEHDATCRVGGREHNIILRQAAGEWDEDSPFYVEEGTE